MSKSALPRRSVIVGAAATVVGWNTVGRSWAVEAPAPDTPTAPAPAPEAADTATLAALPRLDGTLVADGDTLARFGGDFGHLVTAAPRAVLRPGSVRDVATLVGFARRHRIPVAMNGQSGTGETAELESHSSYGQAGVRGGVAIDSRGLDRIIRISPAAPSWRRASPGRS